MASLRVGLNTTPLLLTPGPAAILGLGVSFGHLSEVVLPAETAISLGSGVHQLPTLLERCLADPYLRVIGVTLEGTPSPQVLSELQDAHLRKNILLFCPEPLSLPGLITVSDPAEFVRLLQALQRFSLWGGSALGLIGFAPPALTEIEQSLEAASYTLTPTPAHLLPILVRLGVAERLGPIRLTEAQTSLLPAVTELCLISGCYDLLAISLSGADPWEVRSLLQLRARCATTPLILIGSPEVSSEHLETDREGMIRLLDRLITQTDLLPPPVI